MSFLPLPRSFHHLKVRGFGLVYLDSASGEVEMGGPPLLQSVSTQYNYYNPPLSSFEPYSHHLKVRGFSLKYLDSESWKLRWTVLLKRPMNTFEPYWHHLKVRGFSLTYLDACPVKLRWIVLLPYSRYSTKNQVVQSLQAAH